MLDFNFKSFVIVPLTATLAMTLMGCGGGGGGKDSVSKTLSSMNIESSSSVASVVSSSSSVQSTIASESSSSVSSSSSSESVVFSSTDSSAQSSTQSSVAPESSSSIASSSSSTSLLMGGAIQGTPLNLKADVTTFVGASAALDEPFGVTTDGTNLYVADKYNYVIRKIVIATGAVSILAGSEGLKGSSDGTGSAARFDRLDGIVTDGTNLFVVDEHSIRKIIISTGVVTTIAGKAGANFGSIDGTGSAARFQYPSGITTDGTHLYVSDTYNNTVRKIVIATGSVTTFAGSTQAGSANGVGTAARFEKPRGITSDGTNLYVSDTDNTTIRKIVLSSGSVSTLAGTIDSGMGDVDGTGEAASFSHPSGITCDGANLYVVDLTANTVRKIVIATGVVTTLAGKQPLVGSVDGNGEIARFRTPIAITTDGKSLFISDRDNNAIRKID